MKMKAVNHKPMIRPEGTLVLQGREEVSPLRYNFNAFKSAETKGYCFKTINTQILYSRALSFSINVNFHYLFGFSVISP
jgi:hypothetical protein